MLKDTLRDSWMYQKVLGEGREEGREEGRIEEARKSIEIVTSARFPETLTSIKNQIISLTDEVQLQHILNVVALAQTIEEVQQALSTMRQSSAAKIE